jgi:hypothetical protein
MKIELERYRDQVDSVNAAAHRNQCVFLASASLSSRQAVTILAFVFKFQMIDRFKIREQLSRVSIQTQLKSPACANAHVMIALGADLSVAFEIRLIEHGFAFNALLPQPLGNAGP